MLGSQSCLISRALPSSCKQEPKWIYMTRPLLEITNNKRPLLVESLEFKEEPSEKRPKSEKHLDSPLPNEDIEQLPPPNDQPDSQGNCDGNEQSSDDFELKEDPGQKEPDSSENSDSSHDSSEDDENEDGEDDGSQPPNDQSNRHDHNNNSDQYLDSDSLINPIGRDISIKCFLHCSRSDYGALASISKAFRYLIRSGELYRLRRLDGITEHWIYFSCNLLQWEAYDPYRRQWLTLPMMPRDEIFMSSDKESLAVGTDLLVFGRGYPSLIILRYSLLTNSWSSGVPMTFPRCLFGSASFGQKAIVAGGVDFDGNLLSSAELYDSENQTWMPLPRMNKPRRMCSGIFMDNKFYVIGGISNKEELLTCGEEYDLDKGTWTVIPNMSSGLHGHTGAPPLLAVVNNDLYAADYEEKKVKKFDKGNRAWTTIGKLPERPDSVNGWGLAFRACGERIIVVGGPRVIGGAVIELNSWTPREGPPEWNLIASKRSGSFVYNCAVMGC